MGAKVIEASPSSLHDKVKQVECRSHRMATAQREGRSYNISCEPLLVAGRGYRPHCLRTRFADQPPIRPKMWPREASVDHGLGDDELRLVLSFHRACSCVRVRRLSAVSLPRCCRRCHAFLRPTGTPRLSASVRPSDQAFSLKGVDMVKMGLYIHPATTRLDWLQPTVSYTRTIYCP